MKTGLSGITKWLALAVCVLAAGFCYSCSLGGQNKGISHMEMSSKASENGGQGFGSEAEDGSREAGDGKQEAAYAGAASGRDGTEAEDSGTGPAQTCFVHVCGEVERPGVYELEDGQRVFEAVELAGGFTADAAESFLNLAEPVRDGMKIQVPDKRMAEELLAKGLQTGQSTGAVGSSSTDNVRTKININTAGKEELMTLRGIGEARAEDIIRYRQQSGGFKTIEDIMKVSGIKDAAFQKIKDDITV